MRSTILHNGYPTNICCQKKKLSNIFTEWIDILRKPIWSSLVSSLEIWLLSKTFVIAINVLSRLLNKAAVEGKIGYHPTCSEVNLTHLSFADDIMVFTDGDPASLRGIFGTLDEFAAVSGIQHLSDSSPGLVVLYHMPVGFN